MPELGSGPTYGLFPIPARSLSNRHGLPLPQQLPDPRDADLELLGDLCTGILTVVKGTKHPFPQLVRIGPYPQRPFERETLARQAGIAPEVHVKLC